MSTGTLRDLAAAVAAVAALLLLVDLGLGWYEVNVTAGGVVAVSTTSSGWSDVGLVAGLVTIALLVYMARPLRADASLDVTQAVLTCILGVSAFALTVAAALTGSASVTAPLTAVEVSQRLWPAYVGIGLATVVGLGTFTAFVLYVTGATAPSRHVHVPLSR
jgi:hypothetical protein